MTTSSCILQIKYTKIRQLRRTCQIRVYLIFLCLTPRRNIFLCAKQKIFKSNDYNTILANKYSRGINICDENLGLNELMHPFHMNLLSRRLNLDQNCKTTIQVLFSKNSPMYYIQICTNCTKAQEKSFIF